MASRINYEWTIEEIDQHGDIVDCDFSDTLAGFGPINHVDGVNCRLGLVRNVSNKEHDDLEHRAWAYVDHVDGTMILPDQFTDGGGAVAANIPKRFRAELSKLN